MDKATELLFGSFPRSVAPGDDEQLHQFFVHSAEQFDQFVDKAGGGKNLYASICRFTYGNKRILDKVCYDLDSPMKEAAFPERMTDDEKINRMREDRDVAEEVLGPVFADAQCIVQRSFNEGIPTVTVFSGMGFHIHQLFKERKEPTDEIETTANRFIEACNATTFDQQVIGDVRRVLRVPNKQRFDYDEDGRLVECPVWTIPLTEEEVLQADVTDILDMASGPKEFEVKDQYLHHNRPEMCVYEGYESNQFTDRPQRDLDVDTSHIKSETAEWIIDHFMDMPCMRERIKQPNPEHKIRLNFAIQMFNYGFTPEEVQNIIEQLNWVDYDEEKTRRYLQQTWKRGYSDHSCSTLRHQGLCVKEDPYKCETYGWLGGNMNY